MKQIDKHNRLTNRLTNRKKVRECDDSILASRRFKTEAAFYFGFFGPLNAPYQNQREEREREREREERGERGI